MDFLKSQLARLQQQFAALTASQKMLALSLVTIMVMTMLWWGRYAGQAEMEEVLPQDFAAEEVSRITSQLTGKGIPYRVSVSGTRILVPSDRKIEVLADLSYAQMLPHDTSSAFEEIISKMSTSIDSPSKTDTIHNHAKEVMLGQMIRYFPKVRSAMVMIDPTIRRSFDNPVLPSATVNIQLKNGEKLDKRLASAAADVVVGSVAGMERKRVKVIVDGASQQVDDDSEGGFAGGSLMDIIRDWEKYYSRKVQDQLYYVDGAMVHVTVELNDEHISSQTTAYDPKTTVKAELTTSTKSEETTMTSRGGSDPGVNSNAGAQIPTATATGDQTHTVSEGNQTTFDNKVGTSVTTREKKPGLALAKSVSVALPRSYFSKIYQQSIRSDKEPPKAVLDPFIDELLPHMREQVKGCLGLKADEAVVVTTFMDLMPVAPDSTAQASSGVSMLIGGHAKEIALGALALVSLFMVSTMVRKASPAPVALDVLAEAALASGVMGKSGKGGPAEEAAEVGEGAASLDGVELDSEAVRGQQMVEQVTTLVKENPDAAANLVKRWLNRA